MVQVLADFGVQTRVCVLQHDVLLGFEQDLTSQRLRVIARLDKRIYISPLIRA